MRKPPTAPVPTKPPDSSFNLPRLRQSLPFHLHYFPRLRSTNDHAAALRRRGTLFAPAVVLTPHQTAGRGRAGNAWFSAASHPGAVLTVTFVLPVEEHLSPHHLPLIAGLAVHSAAAELTSSPNIQLKWPNDILHAGRKLAGLLCERVHNADLVGLGLNVNLNPSRAPKHLRDKITSLSHIAAHPFDPTDVLLTVARHLKQTLTHRHDRPFTVFLREYDAHHALVGRRVRVITNGVGSTSADDQQIAGTCQGIDNSGRLVLRDRHRTHHVIAGHVLLA